MALVRVPAPLALVAASIAFLALAACGRAGSPLLPPSSAPGPVATAPAPPPPTGAPSLGPSPAAQTAAKTGFDAQGNPVATPGKKGGFILDPLLQ